MPCHDEIPCPKCGTYFECKLGSSTICDCNNIQVPRDLAAYLQEEWEECLCMKCLAEEKAQWEQEKLIPTHNDESQ
ncbi:cysteine-rich CWC family protein [Salinibius halmophilus]|uniref:cysteine-rich CWC family protein n=1 Tax=Salinibius halmophilus TaxID=1853216 RepID=UPI000E664E5A|nr:cysteine-rich CWC family protein [Salinibius halmophilus]